MALPWLIGGLAVYAAKKLADKLMDDDDDDDDDSSYDHARATRRREEAERERAENERKKKLETAQENFAIRGENIGRDIAQSLKDWIEVTAENSPTFTARLNSEGYKIEQAIHNEQDTGTLLPGKKHQFKKIREHLTIYSDLYCVKLTKGAKMVKAANEVETIDCELKQLETLKAEISRLQSDLSAQL